MMTKGKNEYFIKGDIAEMVLYHKEDRAEEILLALVRYSVAEKVIPKEWIEELCDLMKGMKWGDDGCTDYGYKKA